MPPAKTIIRSGQNFDSVSNFHTTSEHKSIFKPYNPSSTQRFDTATKNDCKISTSPGRHSASKYMDLNEFFQNIDKNQDDSSSPGELDPDYPKPTVDLLASLLTLGKMIQNQKQLIQNQSQNASTSPSMSNSSLPSLNSFSNYSENDVNTQSGEQPEVHIENVYLEAGDVEEMFPYTQKKTLSSSSSPLSKRRVIPDDIKDIDYWDRRKRNNLAAKKSREERRKKELEIVETTKQLEKENSQLTIMLKRLTSRNEWLESRLQDIRCRRRNDTLMESSSLSSEES